MTRKNALISILFSSALIVLLSIAAINITKYSESPKVLSAQSLITDNVNDQEFWIKFLETNPNYIPGWIEIGRIDRVLEIDPNYFR